MAQTNEYPPPSYEYVDASGGAPIPNAPIMGQAADQYGAIGVPVQPSGAYVPPPQMAAAQGVYAPNTTQPGGFDPSIWQEGPQQLESVAQMEESSVAPMNGQGLVAALKEGAHLKTLFFSLACLAGVILLLIGLSGGQLGFVIGGGSLLGIGWVGGLIEVCFVSSTGKYLKNILAKDEVYAHLHAMKKKAPLFWMSIQNYHYHTETYTDSNGNRKTRRRRVNTHHASGHFVYSCFRDASLAFPNLEKFMLTKVKLDVEGLFGDAFTSAEYARQMNLFKSLNIRDSHFDFRTGIRLDGLKKRVLCEAEPGVRGPCMDYSCYLVTALLCVSFCFRVWMASLTGKCHFYLKKEVFCVPRVMPAQVISVAPMAVNPVIYAPIEEIQVEGH